MKRWKAAAGAWRGLRVVDAVGGGEADLYLYDAIDSWGGEWGVSAKEVVAALVSVRAATLNVHLNSPGGDYFEGVAIRTALVGHAATVNIFVDGLAASAASVVATAGERVVIAQGGQIMIHEARTISIGTADDMRGTADVLDKIGDDIAGMYAARAGGEVAEWRGLMRAETWFTADEAVAAGLADELAAGPARPDEPEEPDEPDEDEPAGARAAARWVQQWRHPGRDAAPAPENPVAPAAAAPPPAAAAAQTPKVDPELFRSAIREAVK